MRKYSKLLLGILMAINLNEHALSNPPLTPQAELQKKIATTPLRQKIGQMIMVGIHGTTPQDVEVRNVMSEIEKGNINKEQFTKEKRAIKLHGHCQQKALSSVAPSVKMLSLPDNYSVEVIPSGCCGMAGSFGYEKEHYDLSMKIGELVLFPAVRNRSEGTLIAAAGTSCRHQVKDGTGVKALHPVEILWNALA